ncbi:unnamed protein product [Rotaria socialis]
MQRYFILISIILSCVSTITDISSSSTPTCGYCPSSYCPVKSQPCSSNSDCECLLMAMTGGGMCADTVISCQSLSPCGNDNQTCSSPDTLLLIGALHCLREYLLPPQRHQGRHYEHYNPPWQVPSVSQPPPQQRLLYRIHGVILVL